MSHKTKNRSILSSPPALDNCFLKDKTCVTLGELCISASIHVGIRKKSLAFHIFIEKSQGTALSLPSGMAMAICHPSSTAETEFEVTGTWITTARQVTENWEHSSYVCQLLSKCVLGRTKLCVTFSDLCITVSVHIRTGKCLEILILWWESQIATIRHKFCRCPVCSSK